MFMLKFQHKKKSASLLCKAKDLLGILQEAEIANPG